MNLKASNSRYIRPSGFHRTVELPSSKSYANRMLILAAVTPGKVKVTNLPSSTDVLTLVELLKQIGLEITTQGAGAITIHNSFPACEVRGTEPIQLETGDGGTTNRFLASMLLLGNNTYILSPNLGMSTRPMDEFIEAAQKLKVTIGHRENNKLTIKGPPVLRDRLEIDCTRTTQVATGIALAFAHEKVEVVPINLESSAAYWEMTKKLLGQCNQREWRVPIDFSSASYPLALAALNGSATFSQIFEIDQLQADSTMIPLLKEIGAGVYFTEAGLKVTKAEVLKSFDIDISKCPDLAPTLAYLASGVAGRSVLRKTSVLKFKETDRLFEIKRLLSLFNVEHCLSGDDLFIQGPLLRSEGEVLYQAPPDHRMIMSAYLFMRTFRPGQIENVHHVDKSFPGFFTTMD